MGPAQIWPPGNLLIVELGQNYTETMLGQYQVLMFAKKICFQYFLGFLKN